MFRGCEYQVWQTANAWLDLTPEQLLYVEAAEDFDIASPSSVTAVQVKSSEHPTSLAREDVQKSIAAYWLLQQKSVGIDISYRFLTRGKPVSEKGEPFGPGIAGMDLWMRGALTDNEIQSVCTYLAEQNRLPESMRSWLRGASPAEVRRALLSRISWVTEAEAVEEVERGVQRKLAAYSAARGDLPASLSTRTARRLFDEIWKTLRKPSPRYLDRLRFEEIWEEEARANIRQDALEAILRQAAFATKPSAIPEQLRVGAPPLPGVVAPRKALVDQLRSTLTASGFLTLHGSTRMGKTTIAKLIIADEATNWRWWTIRVQKAEEINRAILGVLRELNASPLGTSLVLDDFDFSPVNIDECQETLGELIAAARAHRGKVLITSQKPIPSRLRYAFAVSQDQVLAVPKLTIEEVAELAGALGCPSDQRLRLWAALVFARTLGHPQLCAVYLSSVAQHDWPSNLEFQTGVAELDAEKADARQLLAILPDNQRALLHRLSIFPQIFRRDHAIALATTPPPLVAPGDLFDPLIGPWIEPFHEGYFALSQLIDHCATDVFPSERIHELRESAARILVSSEPQTTADAGMAFQLLWLNQNIDGLFALAQSWRLMPSKLFSVLAQNLWWFTAISILEGEVLVATDDLRGCSLRGLQFKIAMAIDRTKASAIAKAWIWECDNTPPGSHFFYRFLVAMELLPYYQVPIPAGTVISLLTHLENTLKAHPELTAEAQISGNLLPGIPVPQTNDLVVVMAYFTSQRCNSVAFLDDFLTALSQITSNLRTKILTSFWGSGAEGQLAMDRAWLSESDQLNPNWQKCLKVFEKAFSLGREWSFDPLSWSAMRGIAIVYDEYLDDHDAAHAAIKRLAGQMGKESFHVYDRQASVYFSEKRYAEAERDWKKALERWPKPTAPFDSTAFFASRNAGISAAKAGDWRSAAALFVKMPEYLPGTPSKALLAAAAADAGYAFWKANLKQDAMKSLIQAWTYAETLPLGKTNLRAFQTRRLVGHIIAWIREQVFRIGVQGLVEPLPGICTSAEVPEAVRKLPEGHPDGAWIFLMHIERACGLGTQAFDRSFERLSTSASVNVQLMALLEAMTRRLMVGEVLNLPSKLIELAKNMREAAQGSQYAGAPNLTLFEPEKFQKNDGQLGSPVFLAALLSAADHKLNIREVIISWREDIRGKPHAGEWEIWFEEIETVLGTFTFDARMQLRETNIQWSTAMLLALKFICAPDTQPDDLFLAHFRWLSEVRTSTWLRDIAPHFCHLVQKSWMRIIEQPQSLQNPNESAPRIREACLAGEASLTKAANILKAANGSVNIRLSAEIWNEIKKLITD